MTIWRLRGEPDDHHCSLCGVDLPGPAGTRYPVTWTILRPSGVMGRPGAIEEIGDGKVRWHIDGEPLMVPPGERWSMHCPELAHFVAEAPDQRWPSVQPEATP